MIGRVGPIKGKMVAVQRFFSWKDRGQGLKSLSLGASTDETRGKDGIDVRDNLTW